MAHGVLLSDHDFLNDLIKINLQGLLGCKVSVVSDVEKFQTLMELDPTYDMVITLTSIKNKCVIKTVSSLCSTHLPNAPVIFLGDLTEVLSSRFFYSLKKYYDVENLVKTLAELLKISLQSFARYSNDSHYFALPMSLVSKLKIAVHDFWKEEVPNQEYIKLAKTGEPLERKIPLWMENEIKAVYVTYESKEVAIKALTEELLSEFEKSENNNVSSETQEQLIEKVGALFVNLFKDPESFKSLSVETKSSLAKTALATDKILREMLPGLSTSLNKLIQLFQKSKMSTIQQHSLFCSYLCTEIARGESWFTTQVYTTITLLSFFHDIVLTTIYIKHPGAPSNINELLTFEGLTENEKNLIRHHPEVVAHYLKSIPDLPIGLDQLVLQHHGNFTGILDDLPPHDDIALLAKILYLSEVFAEKVLSEKSPITEEVKNKILQEVESLLGKKSYQKLLAPLYNIKL